MMRDKSIVQVRVSSGEKRATSRWSDGVLASRLLLLDMGRSTGCKVAVSGESEFVVTIFCGSDGP